MKVEVDYFTRGARASSRTLLSSVPAPRTVVRRDHLQRVLEARRRLGMDEGYRVADRVASG